MMTKRFMIGALFLLGVILAGSNVNAQRYDRYGNLVAIAHELELAVTHVHHEAERQAHHENRREAYALGRLHRMNEVAAHFHNEVERNFRNPRHTERDFRALVNAYNEARFAMRGLHAFDHVYADFGQVTHLMRQLVRVYSPYGNYFPGHGSRYDRDYGYGPYDDDDDDYYYDDEYEDRDYDDNDHDHDDH